PHSVFAFFGLSSALPLWFELRSATSGQRVGEVGDEVVDVLDADREADEAVGDAEGGAVLGGDAGVGHDGGVFDEGLDAAEALGEGEEVDAFEEAAGFGEAALEGGGD